jgi:regulator of protease activity HflC (stomatin/prohibitin superfamily)
VALGGLVIQVASVALTAAVWHWSGGSDAIKSCAVLMLVGVPIWVVLRIVFRQLRRVQAEELETTELRRAQAAGDNTALFEVDREELLIEQSRLKWMVKWLLPATTVILFTMLFVFQFTIWNWSFDAAFQPLGSGGVIRTTQPTLWMWFIVFVGFVCFLFARYTLALARIRQEWEILRAGAACMAASAISCLLLALTLMASSQLSWVEPLYAYLVRAVLLILAVEFALNFVLDFYRPRTRRKLPRPSFESRLFGLVSEPGGIAKSIADAVNYQFGFEVSTTWFYQLLQRWFLPLVVTCFLIILGLSTVVVVEADEHVVVERFGSPWRENAADPNSPLVILGPGIHFKRPFPIDITRRVPVEQISELTIGEASKAESEDPGKAILWTEQHEYVPELMLLVAAPQSASQPTRPAVDPNAAPGARSADRSVSSSLLMVSVPIQYRIKDLNAYLYKYESVEKVMEGVVYQILSDYASNVDIDALISHGRRELNEELRTRFQAKINELGLGIDLVFVGIRGAHPPAQDQVAAAFHEVVSAETRMAATINAARGQEQTILTRVAGSVDRARELDAAIQEKKRIDSDPAATAEQIAAANARLDELLMGNPEKDILPIGGEAAVGIANARDGATQRISEAIRKSMAFSAEVASYNASPELYMARRRLDVYRRLGNVRKYFIDGDPTKVMIEWDDEEQAALDQVLESGADKERSKSGQ